MLLETLCHSASNARHTTRAIQREVMLRNVFPRNQRSDSFICWQCLAKSYQNALRGPSRRTLSRSARIDIVPTQRDQVQHSVFHETTAPSNIREYLKQWQIHNSTEGSLLKPLPPMTSNRTDIANEVQFGTTFHDLAKEEEQSHDEIDNFRPFLKDDLVNVGGQRTFLLPGDLVELM
jgi:hypothetical protein